MKNQEDVNQARLLREYFLNACLLAVTIQLSQETTPATTTRMATAEPKVKVKPLARRKRVPELI